MKAIVCTQYGPPEVLKLVELPKPTPKPHEVLIQIKASAVNSGDARVRGLVVKGLLKPIMRLVLGFNKPRKPILGNVFSGVVESVGNNVKRFKPGDAVFGMTGMRFGTYAEYLCLPETAHFHLMPHNATHQEAAALVFGGQTAIYFLEKMGLAQNPSAKVLIIGGSGAVGTAAIQVARNFKAEVDVVCGQKGEDLVKSLGAQQIWHYDNLDYHTLNKTYDAIFDAIGKTHKKQIAHLLAPQGQFKTVGALEVAAESLHQVEQLKTWFENGQYTACIDRVYPLEQIVQAHHYIDSGRKKGNVVLQIN